MHIFQYNDGEHMIDPALVPLVAMRFKALGDPGRLALLAILNEGERSVGDLVALTRRSQPTVSQQLAGLSRVGFVASRREGTRILYRISDPYVARICEAVCNGIQAGPALRRGRTS
jgi:ArsR family transcriptional regulator